MHPASLWSPIMASDLIKLKNIGPASIRQLREVGIEDAAALRKLGAIAAYGRLKHAFPREVSLVMLYALEGALRGCHWNRLPPGIKEKLQAAARAKPRATR
jgi:DNA transformation protein